MCLNLVAESEKMRKQGHQGVAMKPVDFAGMSQKKISQHL